MKRLIILLTVIAIFLVLAACADSGSAQTDAETGQSDLQALPTVLDQNEYVLYQNIFYNNMADDYIGQTVTKEGTLIADERTDEATLNKVLAALADAGYHRNPGCR